MLTHGQIWSALDRLAESSGLSISALAKRAGLDATTFNRSKRVTPDGRPRWPSTESVAKVLAATGASTEEFFRFLGVGREPGYPTSGYQAAGFAEDPPPPLGFGRAIPHTSLKRARDAGFFDARGLPTGQGWDEIVFPDIADAHAFAMEITGDAMAPIYRDGDIVVVSPSASVRRGDRILVKTSRGELLARELRRRTTRLVEMRAIGSGEDIRLPLSDLQWMARIIWASQ